MSNGYEVGIKIGGNKVAHSIDVPQDFSEIKQKVLLGLTKRQCVFFTAGTVVGIGTYFATKNSINDDIATYLIFLCGAPFFLFAFKNKATNMYIDERIKIMLEFRKSEKLRLYQSESIFEKINRQIEYDKIKTKLNKAGINTEGGVNVGIGEKIFKLLKKLD